MKFSQKLKNLRFEKKVTQEQLAKAINVERSLIGKYESEAAMPSNDTLIKIAQYFNVSTDYLLGVKAKENKKEKGKKIPLFSQVAAGIPISANEDIIDYIEISEQRSKRGEHFGIKVKGDSMQPEIKNNDVVIVRKTSIVENGEIAIVLIGGEEGTCKKIKRTPEGVYLIPLNQTYEYVFYTNKEIEDIPVQIVGKVVEMKRVYEKE